MDETLEIRCKELEEKYKELAKRRDELDSKPELSEKERAAGAEALSEEISKLDEEMLNVAKDIKQVIDEATKSSREMVDTNREYIARAKEDLELRKRELEEEQAKEKPDEGVIAAKTVQKESLEAKIKEYEKIVRKANRQLDALNERLLPLMERFEDRGLFSRSEMSNLRRIRRNVNKRKPKEVITDTVEHEEVVTEDAVEETKNKTEEATKDETEEVKKKSKGGKAAPAEEAVIEEKEEVSKDEDILMDKDEKTLGFDELYEKAKNGELEQKDFDALVGFLSVPENYDKLGITTGLLNNKAKVLLTAMGKFVTEHVHETVNDASNVLHMETKNLTGDIRSTENAKHWSGIKSLAADPKAKLASEELFERIVQDLEDKGIESVGEDVRKVYEEAKGHLANIRKFRTSMDAYSEVKEARKEKAWGWLHRKKETVALAPSVEDAVIDEHGTIIDELGKHVVDSSELTSLDESTSEKEIITSSKETEYSEVGNDDEYIS